MKAAEIGAGRSPLDDVVRLATTRGFVYRSADIYGGFRSAYDYGPLGVNLLRNLKSAWWAAVVRQRHDVVGLDAAILSSPRIWEASGHLAHFSDPMVDCRACKARWRADHLEPGGAGETSCPACGADDLTKARPFNLMFKTHAGPIEDNTSAAYLRPETAQGHFVNFANVLRSTRKTPPFGIAQIGKSFRNEITPGNFVFRTREFEQMELEFFVPPADAAHWHDYWIEQRYRWYVDLGIPATKLRIRPHERDELAHYSSATSDIEFAFPWGWGEIEGVANRGSYDLEAHAAASGKALEVFDTARGVRYVPHVIEPAAGAARAMMAFLLAALDADVVDGHPRSVLRLDPRLAPYQAAVLPLSRKPELARLAEEAFAGLSSFVDCDFDDTQNIGKRYRRQDEIGTPLCVTVDFESLEDHSVTLRDRDTTEQIRVRLEELPLVVRERLKLP